MSGWYLEFPGDILEKCWRSFSEWATYRLSDESD